MSLKRLRVLLLIAAIGVVLLDACAVPASAPAPKESPVPVPSPAQPPVPTPEPTKTETPPPIPKGTPDPEIQVMVYKPEKVWPGTTLLADNHNLNRPRIIEVNMVGEVLWQYLVPQTLKQFTNPGFDIEPLPNGNVLFVLPRNGAYEINRKGDVVWSYLTDKISHDADRLPNGNTLIVFGAMDQLNDAQVKEVNPQGKLSGHGMLKTIFISRPIKIFKTRAGLIPMLLFACPMAIP